MSFCSFCCSVVFSFFFCLFFFSSRRRHTRSLRDWSSDVCSSDLVREPIAEWVRGRYFAGGLTYSGHPLACAVGIASIEAFRDEGIVEHAAEMGPVFHEALH